jgi:hypothetical protein
MKPPYYISPLVCSVDSTPRWETTDLVKYHQIKDKVQHCCGIQTLEYVAATAPTLLDYTAGKATSEFLEVLESPMCGTDCMHSILPHEITTTTM